MSKDPTNAAKAEVHVWDELTREEIKALAPAAVVLVPLGAIEQHGPFLPTGTDIFLSSEAVSRAARRAAEEADIPFLIASFLRIGSSDHHLPFGGTISLPPSTMLQVVTDAIRSMAHSGVGRVILVNGHGGNTGVCHAAAAAITTTTELTVAVVDYFEHGTLAGTDVPVPGHAGQWETSLVRSYRPALVKPPTPRTMAADAKAPGQGVYGASVWNSIDGFTDDPCLGDTKTGDREWQAIEEGLAKRFIHLAQVMR